MARFTRICGAVTVMAMLTITGLVGCGVVDDSSARKAETRTMTDQIQQQLATLPGVVTAKVNYSNQLELSAYGSVDLTVRPGTDPQPLYDESLHAMWQSKLNPLRTVSVDIIDSETRAADGKDFDIDGDTAADVQLKADLEKKYGPRPAG